MNAPEISTSLILLDKLFHQGHGAGSAHQPNGILVAETSIGRGDDGFHIRYLQAPSGRRPCLDNGSPRSTEAKEQMARTAATSPGEYFIHLQGEGIVAKHVTDSRGWGDASPNSE